MYLLVRIYPSSIKPYLSICGFPHHNVVHLMLTQWLLKFFLLTDNMIVTMGNYDCFQPPINISFQFVTGNVYVASKMHVYYTGRN
jgi:hypothetical protein